MRTYRSYVRGLSVNIALTEDDQFTIAYKAGHKSRENGATLLVDSIRAHVDLEDGEVDVDASGWLINKDGKAGERRRDMALDADHIPLDVRNMIVIEWRAAVRKITSVKGVTF